MSKTQDQAAGDGTGDTLKKLALVEKSERHFRAIYEQAPMGITVVDFNSGRFVRWNRKFAELVKREPEELARLTFQAITHPEDLPENRRMMEELRAGHRKFFTMEKRYLLPDGSPVWVNLTVVPLGQTGGAAGYYIGMAEDISARKNAEAAFQRQADFSALVTTMLARFASAVGPAIDEAIRTCMREIALFTGAETACVVLCSPDFSYWVRVYEAAIPGAKPVEWPGDMPMGTFPWTEQRILSGQAVEIRTLDDFPPEGAADRAVYHGYEVVSALSVPLRGRGGLVTGAIALHTHTRPLAWSAEDIRRFRIVADAIANTLERKRVEEELYASRQMLRQILDAIPQRVFWKDLDLRFLGCNKPFALDASAADAGELVGKSDEEMPWGKHYAAAYRADDREVIETGRPKIGYEEQQSRDGGALRWLRTSKAPLRDREGRIFGILGTYEDITDIRQTREALRQAKDAAEAANRAKDQFIAVLSHELRTPLTPVMAVVSALQDQADFPRWLQADMEMIRRNVELEARLIDDLLDVTRLSQGKIILHRGYVDINECVRSAEGFCETGIASKRLQFDLRLEAANPYIWGDSVRIRQVFWNLLQNAVKFTPERGRIEVRTFNERERIKVRIADNGIGIEPEAIGRIFNPFEQGEKTWTRRFGGLGLGLSIAKGIVDLHRGVLSVSSEGKDRGTAFTVELPTVKPPARSVAEKAPPQPATPASTRILLVDDHLDTLRILTRLLRRWGYNVTTADGVMSALRQASGQEFDLLISDLGLPDGSGRDIMRELRPKLRGGIALSGYGTEEDVRSSTEAGFDEHLTKPVSFQALQMAVQRLSVKPGGSS